MPKYLSGRAKRVPQDQLTEDRYQYLGLDQAEPNLSDPLVSPSVPSGAQYQLVAVPAYPGRRYWVPVGGGLVPGAITIFDEDSPVSSSSSITQLNFVGAAVTANVSVQSPSGHPGIAATVTVIPVSVGETPPNYPTPNEGELWWESDTGDLYIYYNDGDSAQWVQTNAGGRGLAGDKGQKGEVGTTGLTGSVGAKGDKGEKGQKGDVEAQGNKGQKGEIGAGQKGQKGDAGTDGTDGDKGQKGEDNSTKGQKGEIGVGQKGQKGEKGTSGGGATVTISDNAPGSASTGDMWWDSDDFDLHVYYGDGDSNQWVSVTSNAALKGQKGEKGEKGEKGQKGEKGEKGQKGEVGLSGNAGGKGEKGQKGEKGDKGQKGEGEKGQKGEDNSTKGQKGDEGDKGEKGVDGNSIKGTKGDKGQKGEDNSTKGQKGEKGEKGQKGVDGTGTGTADKIFENNTSVECVDTGTGVVEVKVDGTETITVKQGEVGINVTDPKATLDVARTSDNYPAINVSGGNNTYGDLTVESGEILQTGHWDRSTGTFTERFRIGTKGALGIEGANYGSSGQVLTSKGGNYPPEWVNASNVAGLKGQKGEAGADNSTKGQKGEAGADNSTKGDKGQKGEVGAQGNPGADNSTKGDKGQKGEDNSTKGQKGEVGSITAAIPSGGIIIWSGASNAIPSGWYLCNGSNGTPDLRNRFIVGAGSGYSVGNTGGSADATLVSHTHNLLYNHGAFGGSSGAVTPRSGNTPVVPGISGRVSTEGSSATNANLPPYYALCYIMKS